MRRSDGQFMGPHAGRADRHIQNVARIAGRLLALHRDTRRTMSPQERADGATWYLAERIRLERIAVDLALPSGTVVAAAATLSPGTPWSVLMDRLPGFIRATLAGEPIPTFPTYGRQRALAWDIVWRRLGVDSASGPKVGPFARALAGDSSMVVVDRHVARYSLDDPSRLSVTTAERRAIQDAHRVVGTAVGLAPRDLQSLLWVARVGFGGDAGGSVVKAELAERGAE